MYYCCGITDAGIRENNEDAFLINKLVMTKAQLETNLTDSFIVGVADGVSGEASGEIASKLVLELLSGTKFTKKTDIRKKILNIHKYIRRYGTVHNKYVNMQTTLCALAIDENNRASIINVGDSKLYLYRNNIIKQLSTDQSLVQMLYENGHITKDQKKNHSQKHIIFPVIGNLTTDPVIDITEFEGEIQFGDLIIICTDGLSDYLTTSEFEEILAEPMGLPKRLAKLIEVATKNGSPDNMTVVGISTFEG